MGRKRKYPKKKQKSPKWYQKENNWGDYVFDFGLGLKGDTWREIFALVVIILATVIFLGFFEFAGKFGTFLADLMHALFGGLPAYAFPIILFWFGILLLFPDKKKQRISRFIGFILLILAMATFFHLFIPGEDAREAALDGFGGGIVGLMISDPLRNSLGLFPTFLIAVSFITISLMMVFDFSFKHYLGLDKDGDDEKDGVSGRVKVNQGNLPLQDEKTSLFSKMKNKLGGMRKKKDENKVQVIEAEPRPLSADTADWKYPSMEILKDSDDVANPGDIQKNAEIIKNTLANFDIPVKIGEVNVGPTVTQYTFKPDDRVKINQVVARTNDLALALASKSLRMEAPIPGRSLIGVENPNVKAARVTLREVLVSKEFKATKSKLAFTLGRDVSGTPMAMDLERLPHVLIAGATGSGKSVCINTIINSFLYNNTPNELKLILIDPKRVELTCYNGIPHLLTPVVIEPKKTISTLKWAIHEMERRYQMFSELSRRNFEAYNKEPGPGGKIPYIVIIIDELADLMATSANDVEGSIVRLAQMARATGIHLVIATQRPSVDVLTGLIKANITARIAFATASQVDSRTILDVSGAEKLLGNGDMLFIGNGIGKPKRVQGCFVSDKEINELVKYLKDQKEAQYDESIINFRPPNTSTSSSGVDGDLDDNMYGDSVQVVTEAGKASATLLQRRLRVGYARAARLLDMLEDNGVVGPAEGSRPRDVLMSPMEIDSGSIASLSEHGEDNNK